MDPQTIAIIGAAIAHAGLNIQLTRGVNRRFDDMNRRFDGMKGETNRRFDDAARANDVAHANIVANVSDLRADFRALIPRPAVEKPPAPDASPTPRAGLHLCRHQTGSGEKPYEPAIHRLHVVFARARGGSGNPQAGRGDRRGGPDARGHRSGNRRVETGAPAAGAAWKTRPSGSSAGLPSRCANLARLKWPTAPAFS